jgi:hypothetical protein
MIELFNKTREQIQLDVSRICSERRASANKGPVKSTSGNLLIDSVTEILVRDGHASTDDILNALKQKGMKHVTKEDLDNLSDPLLLCIGDTWFKREPSRTVYVYAPKSINSIPGATKEKDCIWNCPLTQSLVDFYRENGDQILILDMDIQRIFDILYTPAEKMKKELLAELASLYD